MRQPMVAGNWKMNGARSFTRELVGAVCDGAASMADAVEVVVCPAFPYLLEAVECVP